MVYCYFIFRHLFLNRSLLKADELLLSNLRTVGFHFPDARTLCAGAPQGPQVLSSHPQCLFWAMLSMPIASNRYPPSPAPPVSCVLVLCFHSTLIAHPTATHRRPHTDPFASPVTFPLRLHFPSRSWLLQKLQHPSHTPLSASPSAAASPTDTAS